MINFRYTLTAIVPALHAAITMFVSASGMSQETGQTTVEGFVDAHYAYSFLPSAPRERSFTTQPTRHNEFALNLGMLGVRYQSDDVRGRFVLQTGTYVQSNLAAEPDLFKHILEASAGYRFGDGIWVDVGIFPSHIGFEGILSKDNWTYTRSLLADYSPYYEAGVSVTAAVGEGFTVRGLILNGWQNIAETNSDKAIGTQIQWKTGPSVLLNWSTFAGNEQPDSLASRLRLFSDLYAVYYITDGWSTVMIMDVGGQKRFGGDGFDLWHAGAVIVRRSLGSQWAVAGRLEYYSDPHGVLVPTGTPGNFRVLGGSLNVDFAPSPHFVWRVEVRALRSRDSVYPTGAGLKASDGFMVVSAAMAF